MARIIITKTENNVSYEITDKDLTQEMTESVNAFCQSLFVDSNIFEKEKAFNDILDYIRQYDRLLYAPISNTIYACFDEHEAEEAINMIGTMGSNIESVVAYTQSPEFRKRLEESNSKSTKQMEDARKAVLKIWDHVNLAQQQYSALKQTDEEYRKKFNKSISPIVENITKDMNAQLLTMIGIFTALAFLIFGGISSLDNIFGNLELPLFKLMVIGAVWGICILNLVFIFMFCVGKMTKLNFKSTDDKNANIFQKYPIVWWSNLIIASIMILSIWGYYLTKNEVHNWFDEICIKHSALVSIIGTAFILALIVWVARKLIKVTKYTNGNEDK